jgi:large subunit ribosomal protein L15
MKTLGNLSPAPGSHRKTKRLGRGIGSGLGKTAGKGHKGQKARKSGGIRPGFEGGQTPLYRRIPKTGFTNKPFANDYSVVNLRDLNRFENGAVVTAESLLKLGLIKSTKLPVKLLGAGTLEKKVTVQLDKLSDSAKVAVEKAGGTVKTGN